VTLRQCQPGQGRKRADLDVPMLRRSRGVKADQIGIGMARTGFVEAGVSVKGDWERCGRDAGKREGSLDGQLWAANALAGQSWQTRLVHARALLARFRQDHQSSAVVNKLIRGSAQEDIRNAVVSFWRRSARRKASLRGCVDRQERSGRGQAKSVELVARASGLTGLTARRKREETAPARSSRTIHMNDTCQLYRRDLT
jgi:hypothetical protein